MQLTGTDFPMFSINGSTSGIGSVLGIGSSGGYVGTYSNHGFSFITNDTVRATITSGGNVGIGTTSPSSLLHLIKALGNDVISIGESGSNARLKIGQESGYTGNYIDSTNIDLKLLSNLAGGTGGNIILYTGSSGVNTERMRITSGGNVLIGTTSNDFGSRQVNSSATSYTFHSVRTGTGSEGHLVFSNANGAVGSIFTDGSSTYYNTSSDYRLKQDLKDYSGLSLLNNIKTYDYQWKSDNTRMHGVLAHELQEIIPYAVNGKKDDEQMQGVDYSKLVPVLVKAIQEQQAQIEELKALINK